MSGPSDDLERERLRLEVLEWRRRALEAEAAKAEWEALRGRVGWRLYMSFLRTRARLAPAGSRRDRLVRGVTARFDSSEPQPTGRRRVAKGVLFLSGLSGASLMYRCAHQGEAFAFAGGTFDAARLRDVDLHAALEQYQCYVLHRVPWTREVAAFVEAARQRGKPLIFDSDDLVFDPEFTDFRFLDQMPDGERRLLLDGVHLLHRTLTACDGATVSTDPLQGHARRFAERVAVTYNVAGRDLVAQADAILDRRSARTQTGGVTIGYFSGTPTHDRDFAEAADAVVWVLERFPELTLRVVGFIGLDTRFDRFGSRVERVAMRPWRALLEDVAAVDVNLAPLESNSDFTEGKSCVKYIEAGLVGVPTVASPRSDFVRAIDHGRNGLLAEGVDEWRNALEQLVALPERRRELGRAAYEDVRRNHVTIAIARRAFDSLSQLVGDTSTSAPLSVNWVVSDATPELRRPADFLAERGHRVTIYAQREAATTGPAEVVVGHDALGPADATIAAGLDSAAVVVEHEFSLFKFLYDDGPGDDLPLGQLRPGSPAQLEEHLQTSCFLRLRRTP